MENNRWDGERRETTEQRQQGGVVLKELGTMANRKLTTDTKGTTPGIVK
jgi:hypothetical protein